MVHPSSYMHGLLYLNQNTDYELREMLIRSYVATVYNIMATHTHDFAISSELF